MSNRAAALAALTLLASCGSEPVAPDFPQVRRPVAPIVGDSFSTEDTRERVGEAEQVMQFAGIGPSMWVADVGAGRGYYTVRLAREVGPKGRVLAEDIVADVTDQLADRVQRERLDNVAVRLGTPDNPMLPPRSFDRVFMVHMYHEVTNPYAFLWHLREGLKPGGALVVVDADRPANRHGMPPDQLRCELAALNLQAVKSAPLAGGDGYMMMFRTRGPRPEPHAIKPCAG